MVWWVMVQITHRPLADLARVHADDEAVTAHGERILGHLTVNVRCHDRSVLALGRNVLLIFVKFCLVEIFGILARQTS